MLVLYTINRNRRMEVNEHYAKGIPSMKLFGCGTKCCAVLFFSACLLLWGILAWRIGAAEAMEIVWVAREKIVGAEPSVAVEQVNIGRGLLFGVPVFVIGGLISVALSELYYAALRYFRGETP